MNRNFWQHPMFLMPLAALVMTVSCNSTPAVKTTQTRALEGAPAIVSIDPPDGATGVKKDTNIVVTFNQPMDTGKTEAAYYSKNEELDSANVRFSWNSDNTELTIDPDNDLQYNSGTNPDEVIAKQYSFGFSERAMAISGDSLPSTDSGFGTLKFISAKISYYLSMEMDTNDRYPGKLFALSLGDNAANLGVRAFAFFNILELPATLVSGNILSATLRLYKKGVTGSPYVKLNAPCTTYYCAPRRGSVQVDHVSDYLQVYYDSPVQVALGDLDTPAFVTSTSIPFRGYYETTTPNGWKSLSVTEAIKYDVKNRVIRGLYSKATFRLSFQRNSNNNNQADSVEFASGTGAENTPELFVYYFIQ